MNAEQAIQSFWESFGIAAYDETTVPDDAKTPYITYEMSKDFFDQPRQVSAAIWYRSPSWKEITEKEKEIADKIGRGGIIISSTDGPIWIQRGTPWAHRLSDNSDRMIRRIALTLIVEFLI